MPNEYQNKNFSQNDKYEYTIILNFFASMFIFMFN